MKVIPTPGLAFKPNDFYLGPDQTWNQRERAYQAMVKRRQLKDQVKDNHRVTTMKKKRLTHILRQHYRKEMNMHHQKCFTLIFKVWFTSRFKFLICNTTKTQMSFVLLNHGCVRMSLAVKFKCLAM